jgi:hypothetical protein
MRFAARTGKVAWILASTLLLVVFWLGVAWTATSGSRYCSERYVAFFDVLDFSCYGGKGLPDKRIPIALADWLTAAFGGWNGWVVLAGFLAGVILVAMHRYDRRRTNASA